MSGWYNDEHAATCSLEYGTPHQELRISGRTDLIALHFFLTRVEHQNCYHAKREEMPGLQDIEKSGKRTLPL